MNTPMNASLVNLARLGKGIRSRRFSSYDRTGGNHDFWAIKSGQTMTMADMHGAGCVRHLWMTTHPMNHNLRALILRMYWDGEPTPSVSAPLADFFGLGHAVPNYFQSLPLQVMSLGMNCWFPMPYVSGARITITNESPEESSFYFYVDYHEYDSAPADLGRFHCCWRRELVVKKDEKVGPNTHGIEQRLNTTGRDNYLVLDVEGKGHYVGCVIHLDTNEAGWWGEGDDMFFIDGEVWPPSLHGTGLEDYFCGAWNYNHLSQTFCAPYFGYSFRGNVDYTGKHSQYRFHIEDPIYFEKSLRFSIEHGHANDKQGDWTSTAYWYQIGRTRPLPEVGDWPSRLPYGWGGTTYLYAKESKDRKELPV